MSNYKYGFIKFSGIKILDNFKQKFKNYSVGRKLGTAWIYEGEFLNGKMHGFGRYIHWDWKYIKSRYGWSTRVQYIHVYIGEWIEDEWAGQDDQITSFKVNEIDPKKLMPCENIFRESVSYDMDEYDQEEDNY